MANKEDDGPTIVFLCNDNTTDNGSGLTNNVTKTARNLCAAWKDRHGEGDEDQRRDHQPSLLAVDTDWLFDCISCGRILGAEDYEPNFPSAKSLWQLGLSLR